MTTPPSQSGGTAEIVPAGIHDTEILAEIQVAASMPNPLNTIFFRQWASHDIQRKFHKRELDRRFCLAQKFICYKAVDTISKETQGFVFGFIEKTQDKQERTRGSDLAWLGEKDPEGIICKSKPKDDNFDVRKAVNREVVRRWYAETKQIRFVDTDGVPCVYLDQLYVRPQFQCTGVGTQLLTKVLLDCIAENLKVYVISLPSAVRFYHKRGFEIASSYQTDLSMFGPRVGGFGICKFQGMWQNGKPLPETRFRG